MALVPIAGLLVLFVVWIWTLVAVNAEFGDRKGGPVALTYTFCTFGFVGLLLLLGRRTEAGALSDWAARLAGDRVRKRQQEEEAGEAEPVFQLVSGNGVPMDQDVIENSPDGGLAAAYQIIKAAVNQEATDVHLEPGPEGLRVRYRIDGLLESEDGFPPDMSLQIISSLKVLASMDVAEKRRAQDGSFSAVTAHGAVNFRASSVGIADGEKMAIRVLDEAVGLRRLQSLGLAKSVFAQMLKIVNSSHGMLVVCGPTGSGKTTTLYAALLEVDRSGLNVITIENPIEYRLAEVNQQGINEKAGITFAGLLRTCLRQDPDILMVGEVRDRETAEIAMQAAMTGHFVYTTVHANDTISSVFRLVNLGVEPFLIATSVSAILAQRLVRRLCRSCRGQRPPTEEELEIVQKAGIPREKVKAVPTAVGCDKCRQTGFKGRIGVFELLVLDDELRSLIQTNPSILELKKAAKRAGSVSLGSDAVRKAIFGLTTLEEAVRVGN